MKAIITSLFLIVLLYGCSSEKNQTQTTAAISADTQSKIIVATGKVEPETDIIALSAPAAGIVKTIFKKDGDPVTKGELLLVLDDEAEQNKIEEIKMQIQTQRTQVELEQTQLKENEVNLRNQQSLLEKSKRLLQSGAETQQAYDDRVHEIKLTEVTIERSKKRIQLALNKTKELSAVLKTAETELQKKQFRSPFSGILLNMQINKGESVNQYFTFAEFAPAGNLMVRAEVDEMFSSNVKPGQKAEIVMTGNDQVIARGEIIMVAPYLKKKSLFSEKPDEQEDRRVREIRIALNDAGNLIINSKVDCKIKL